MVSRKLESVDWPNSHILRDVARDVAALKETDGGNILVYGSATLVQELLRHNLADELRLMIFPTSIGGGGRLFGDKREKKNFTLKGSRVLNNGVVILEYEVLK